MRAGVVHLCLVVRLFRVQALSVKMPSTFPEPTHATLLCLFIQRSLWHDHTCIRTDASVQIFTQAFLLQHHMP